MIAEQAGAQHGVITLRQLVAAGLGADAVRKRVACGRLHRLYPGVFAVGHAVLTTKGRFMAAVLACGRDSALSYGSSARLRGLRSSARGLIDVTSPRRRAGRRLAGIDAHTSTTLLPRDVETVDGIRCTSVARTLLDLAAVLDRRGLERACEQAEVLRVFDLRAVDDVLARARGRRGANRLAEVLADLRPGSTLTRQELEERFLALCRMSNLPRPEVNAWIPHGATGSEPESTDPRGESPPLITAQRRSAAFEGVHPAGAPPIDPGPRQQQGFIHDDRWIRAEADFMWRAQRLDVELDGRDVHMTPQAFERDRLRDQQLQVQGWRVVRFTGRHVRDDPRRVAATIRALLGPLPAAG